MFDSSTSQDSGLRAAKFLAAIIGGKSALEAIEDGRKFRWFPQEDISVYELAVSQYLLGLMYGNSDWRLQQRTFDAMPPEVQRHFRVKSLATQEPTAA